eukprot:1960183-Rhodomonas_salina.1
MFAESTISITAPDMHSKPNSRAALKDPPRLCIQFVVPGTTYYVLLMELENGHGCQCHESTNASEREP